MSDESEIIQLFKQLSAGEDIDAVTNQLLELLQKPETLFIFLQIAASNSDEKIRKYSMVFARKYIFAIYEQRDNIECSDVEYLFPLKEELIKMAINEPSKQLKNFVCDVIEFYAGVVIAVSTWPEITQFAMNLIQEKDQALLALNLVNRIYQAIPNEEKEEITMPYITLISNSLSSEDSEIRIQAIDCLSDLLFENESDEDEELVPNLMEMIKALCEKAVEEADKNECSKLFGYLFLAIFYDRYKLYNENLSSFCEFAFSAIQNSEVDPNIKTEIHQILDEGPRVIPDYFSEHLADYLKMTLDLSFNICESDREMPDYQFNDTFLNCLSSSLPDVDSFYSTMLECINELFEKESPAGIQVALFALSCVAQNCTDPILEEPDQIIELVLKGLQSDDDLIIFNANELLLSLIENSSSCLSNYIDELVSLYAPRIVNIKFLQTLSALLAYADHPPKDLNSLIHVLLEMLNHQEIDFKSDIIRCISSSISHAEVDESLYQEIAPHLIEHINQDQSLFNDVFNCFGYLLFIAPKSVIGDIQTIMEILFNNCIENSGCATTLYIFIENLPVSMEPFKEAAVQFCQLILNKDMEKFVQDGDVFDEENDFDTKYEELSKQRGAAIKILAYLLPDQDYVEKVISLLISPSMTEQKDASSSIIISARSLFQSKVDPSKILEQLFQQLIEQEDPEISAEMINAINSLISSYPSNYIIENIQMISQLIIQILDCNIKCFTTKSDHSSPEEKVFPSLYELFNHFVETVGESFNQLLPFYQDKLVDLSKGSSRNMRGYAAMMLAQIAFVIQSPDILQLCFTSINMNVKLKHVFVRINIFNAFRILLRNVQVWQENEQFAKLANDIQNNVHGIVIPFLNSVVSGNSEAIDLFESAAALWSRCVIVFGWKDIPPKDIATILSKIDILFENDFGKSIDYAELVMGFAGDEDAWDAINSVAAKLAIRIFVQDQWYFVRTSPEIIEFFKNILIQSGDINKLVLENVHSNERVLKTVNERIG